MTVQYVPQRVPLVDPRNGIITREWYLLFQALFSTGSSSDNPELITALGPSMSSDFATSAIDDLRDDLSVAPAPPQLSAAALGLTVDDLLPVIGALRDEVAFLRTRINDLQQGTPVL